MRAGVGRGLDNLRLGDALILVVPLVFHLPSHLLRRVVAVAVLAVATMLLLAAEVFLNQNPEKIFGQRYGCLLRLGRACSWYYHLRFSDSTPLLSCLLQRWQELDGLCGVCYPESPPLEELFGGPLPPSGKKYGQYLLR